VLRNAGSPVTRQPHIHRSARIRTMCVRPRRELCADDVPEVEGMLARLDDRRYVALWILEDGEKARLLVKHGHVVLSCALVLHEHDERLVLCRDERTGC